MEDNNSVFVQLDGDDPDYADRFFDACAGIGIPAQEISPRDLLAIEPNLTKDIRRVAVTPDAVIEALRFALSFAATARVNGAKFLRFTELKDFLVSGNHVTGVRVEDRVTGELYDIEGDLVINAGGPWAAKIAKLVDIDIPLSLSPGIHVILGTRLLHWSVNRLHMPSSGDFLFPLGQSTILGTSSWTVHDPDYLYIPEDQIQQMRDECGKLVPAARHLPARGINAASRPLLAAEGKSERDLSRTFRNFDHLQRDNIEGFLTITGGKMVTARAMAKSVSDLVCRRLGVDVACQTDTYPLVSYRRLYTG